MTKAIIEDGSSQAKKFIAYVGKSTVVKSYPLALFLHVAENSYTHFVYLKLLRCKQDIQNTHLEDWIEIANQQLIMRQSTQSAKKRISTEKYAYLRVVCKRRKYSK